MAFQQYVSAGSDYAKLLVVVGGGGAVEGADGDDGNDGDGGTIAEVYLCILPSWGRNVVQMRDNVRCDLINRGVCRCLPLLFYKTASAGQPSDGSAVPHVRAQHRTAQ